MMTTLPQKNVLIVRHLPSALTDSEKVDLLKYFGSSEVRVMPVVGRMKHTAFATFENHLQAKKALERLHQKEILNCILTVEFAKDFQKNEAYDAVDDNRDKEAALNKEIDESSKKESLPNNQYYTDILPPIAPHFGIKYPADPGLKYKYPAPNSDILLNICSALLTVPRLYNQVLHLMNKMHLVPPFGAATSVPPILIQHFKRLCNLDISTGGQQDIRPPDKVTQEPDKFEVVEMSESESEYESSDSQGETVKKKFLDVDVPERVLTARKRKRKSTGNIDRKKQRLKVIDPSIVQSKVSNKLRNEKTEAFDEVATVLRKSLDIKVPTVLQKTVEELHDIVPLVEISQEDNPQGFGKLPPQKVSPSEEGAMESTDDIVLKDYITEKQLESGRLSKKEMSSSSLYKKYQKGEPTCRLYVKNLSKQVTERDLTFIFGRFVDFSDQNEKNMFDIRVMTQGRMKGQAFVGLPTIKSATEALNATNGYQLINKPMVVHFARSSKPK